MPAGSDVHDGVHEYGWRCRAIHDAVVYYSNGRTIGSTASPSGQPPGGRPVPATTPAGGMRFADFTLTGVALALISGVREGDCCHRAADQIEPWSPSPSDQLARTRLEPTVLVTGADFYGPLAGARTAAGWPG